MLAPLVRFCLKNSITFPEFVESARVVFVNKGAEEMAKGGKKVNVSRLAMMTGIQRKAVVRIYREGEESERPSKVAQIIGKWSFDKRFHDKEGRPRKLTFGSEESEFSTLVREVNKEFHPSLLLFELERIGAIKRGSDDLTLLEETYSPTNNQEEIYKLLANDVNDLMDAVISNVENTTDSRPNFHATSVFDNVIEEDIPKIREWFMKHLSSFHSQVEKYLSKKDQDLSGKKDRPAGKRIVYGSFTRTT